MAIAAPSVLLSIALPGAPVSALDEPFVRTAGATMAISAAVEYCLKDAADNNRLTSLTYQRLLFGVAVKSSGYVLAFAASSALWNPVLTLTYPTLSAASAIASALVLSQVQHSVATSISNNGASSAGSRLRDLLPSLPSTTTGYIYLVFAVLYVATAAGCYAPEALWLTTSAAAAPAAAASSALATAMPAVITDVSVFLKATWAPGFALAAITCLVLADAADRGRLSGGTFRRLNMGLAVTEAAYTAVLLPAVLAGTAVGGPQGWSNLIGSVGISAFCTYQYVVNAKKK